MSQEKEQMDIFASTVRTDGQTGTVRTGRTLLPAALWCNRSRTHASMLEFGHVDSRRTRKRLRLEEVNKQRIHIP